MSWSALINELPSQTGYSVTSSQRRKLVEGVPLVWLGGPTGDYYMALVPRLEDRGTGIRYEMSVELLGPDEGYDLQLFCQTADPAIDTQQPLNLVEPSDCQRWDLYTFSSQSPGGFQTTAVPDFLLDCYNNEIVVADLANNYTKKIEAEQVGATDTRSIDAVCGSDDCVHLCEQVDF